MAKWRRILIGDAFRLYSHDFNYYRDLALFWPFLLFSIITLSEFSVRTTTQEHRTIMAVIAFTCLILAKEKLLLLGASLGFVAMRCVWAFALGTRDIKVLITLAVSVSITVLIIFVKRNRRLSYEYPEKTGTLDVVVGLGSLVGTLALKIWLDKLLP
jgi:hypothetical protein